MERINNRTMSAPNMPADPPEGYQPAPGELGEWRKRSNPSGNCVTFRGLVGSDNELAAQMGDDKDPLGNKLTFDKGPWNNFIGALVSGELQRPQ